jgi:hypothetical protein
MPTIQHSGLGGVIVRVFGDPAVPRIIFRAGLLVRDRDAEKFDLPVMRFTAVNA